MLSKALITAAVVFIALASNGAGSLAARDPLAQPDQRRVVVPAPECEEGGGVEQDQREEFHQTYPLSATGRITVGRFAMDRLVAGRLDASHDRLSRPSRR